MAPWWSELVISGMVLVYGRQLPHPYPMSPVMVILLAWLAVSAVVGTAVGAMLAAGQAEERARAHRPGATRPGCAPRLT